MLLFYLKGYSTIAPAVIVEQRILAELLNFSGVVSAHLLDENGLVMQNLNSGHSQNYSSLIAVMSNSDESQSVTITSQNAILIANRLVQNYLLVVRLQSSCNLGAIRNLLS